MTDLRGARRACTLAAVSAVVSLVTGCSTFSYPSTPLPQPTPTTQPSSPTSAAPPAECANPLASYQPSGALPKAGSMPEGSYMRAIQDRGRLIAGVSADTYLLASRNPLNGRVEGFDIDMVKAIAEAIFGNENAYELKVITAPSGFPRCRRTASTSSPAT